MTDTGLLQWGQQETALPHQRRGGAQDSPAPGDRMGLVRSPPGTPLLLAPWHLGATWHHLQLFVVVHTQLPALGREPRGLR